MNRSPFSSRILLMSFALLIFSSSMLAKRNTCFEFKPPCKPESCCIEIKQCDLPYTICKSGDYYINRHLTYSGTSCAIQFGENVENVNIYINGSLTITNPAPGVAAICGANVSDIAIKGGKIVGNNMSANALVFDKSEALVFEDLIITDFNDALLLTESTNITTIGCTVENNSHAGAFTQSCTSVGFENSVFKDNGIGIFFAAGETSLNKECQITRCDFPNSTGKTNIFAQSINGLNVSDSALASQGGTFGVTENLMQIGDDQNGAFNITIFDSTATNASTNSPLFNPDIEGIVFLNGSGLLLDSVVVDLNHLKASNSDSAGIRLSSGANTPVITTFSSGIIRNTVVCGFPANGIFLNAGTNGIDVDSCLVDKAVRHGILASGAFNCTVKNCTTTGCGIAGIGLLLQSLHNALISNVSNGNLTYGILVGADCFANLLENNKCFGNFGKGILDNGSSNGLFHNTEFANP